MSGFRLLSPDSFPPISWDIPCRGVIIGAFPARRKPQIVAEGSIVASLGDTLGATGDASYLKYLSPLLACRAQGQMINMTVNALIYMAVTWALLVDMSFRFERILQRQMQLR